jgi:hypothetical protein
MDIDFDRVQITFSALFLLAGITLIVSFILGKLTIMNDAGYTGSFIMGIAFLYTGFKRLSQGRKEGGNIVWYKQPWIMSGIVVFAVVLSNILHELF